MRNRGLKDWSADLSPDETAWIPGNISPRLCQRVSELRQKSVFYIETTCSEGGCRFTSQLAVDWNMWTSCTCLNEICTSECPWHSPRSVSSGAFGKRNIHNFLLSLLSPIILSLILKVKIPPLSSPLLFVFSPKCLRCSSLCEISS